MAGACACVDPGLPISPAVSWTQFLQETKSAGSPSASPWELSSTPSPAPQISKSQPKVTPVSSPSVTPAVTPSASSPAVLSPGRSTPSAASESRDREARVPSRCVWARTERSLARRTLGSRQGQGP